jgi:hypothetical protein
MTWRTTPVRLLIGAIALTVVATACASTGSIPNQEPERLTPPPLSAQDEARLLAEAITRSCVEPCDTFALYVHDVMFTVSTLSGSETPMPPETIEAIRSSFPDAVFVSMKEADALFGDDALVDGGKGVLVFVGPLRFLRDDVVGIEVGMSTARYDGHGHIEQFLWNGQDWEPTDSTVTGVTTTSWVS